MMERRKLEKEIRNKLDLVIHKLLHLEEAADMPGLEAGAGTVELFKRDFGMEEWDWPQGVGLYGLQKLIRFLGRNEYKEYMIQWYKKGMAEGIGSRNINTTAPLLALCSLNEELKDPAFEELCLDWARWLMECLPRTREGGFQHVTSANRDRKGVRLNESEIWVDTIFMTILFLNRMGLAHGRKEWIEEARYQMLLHIKYLYDKRTGLFHHGWSFNRMDNFGGIFWCRGNSWFTAGVLDYLEAFNGRLEAGYKEYLISTYKAQVFALLKLQSKSGLWHTVLTDSDTYEEVSGSAGIAAGILRGMYLGILEDDCQEAAFRAVDGILNNITEDGTVLNVSAGTGIGLDKEHYNNILIAPMAYGQSLVILALLRALEYLSK